MNDPIRTDPMKGVFRGFDIASAGLRAELQRSEVVASNLSNMHSTGNARNAPYRRKVLQFEEMLEDSARGAARAAARGEPELRAGGVRLVDVREDLTPFPVFHQPGHPDADESGRVLGSNVDLFQELVEMQVIERAFEANLTALRAYRGMLQSTITNMRP